ncbi:MAG: MATE family efflux transporter [Treponema sp.]|nr:MATE family efflux transporter [Treponema sp.]
MQNEIKKVNRGAMTMLQLSLPLIAENFFRTLVSSVDTFMLSSYSGTAVAGVGLVSQWVFFIQVLFNVICIGSGIVLAQYLGANKKDEELNHIAKGGFFMTIICSLVFMIVIFFITKPLLGAYTLEEEVRKAAFNYFMIYGGIGVPIVAISMFQTNILRTYGYTKETLIITIIVNILNVLGNAVAIFGIPFLNIPVTGAGGVAGASVFAILVGNIVMFFMIRKRKDIQFKLFNSPKVPKSIYKLILSIGVPTAGENLSYNVAQIVIMAMITSMGTFAMQSQVYTQTIVRFVFAIASATGSAVQIKVGYLVGAGQKDVAHKKVFKYSLIATSCSMFLILLVNIIKGPIIGWFTDEQGVIELTSRLLIFSIYLEFGRSLNLVYVGALKGAGDVKFPVFYGIFSMWGIMVFLSWLIGVHFGIGIVGCWLGIGTDETTRGIVMALRWKGKRWQKKSLV